MYSTYFGFKEKPFTIAPNPQYLFMSKRHEEALAHMLYAMQGEGGIMVLTGEVGTGKTTICRSLLNQIPENTNIAYIINPKQSEAEMLASVCDELHISYENTRLKTLTDALNQYLLHAHAEGRHTVLIIDEAQQLDTAVLEQLRLLTNLETNDKKLLQIMLLGQPELADVLVRKDLRQFAQRITSRYHLTPLNQDEVIAYMNHRLSIAGCDKQMIFAKPVLQLLYHYSGGIPRLINLIADRALLGAYASEQKQVNKAILQQAKEEVLGKEIPQTNETQRASLLPYILLLLGLALAVWWWNNTLNKPEMIKPLSLNVETTPAPITLKAQPQETINMPETPASEVVTQEEPQHIIPVQPEPKPLPMTTEKTQAFIPVFQAWGINYHPEHDGEACAFAQKHQLLCLRQRENIAQMRSLNRPAVLAVSNDEGERTYTAITRLTGTTATAAVQDSYAQIPLASLALQSFNDFTLLWKTPTGYQGPTRPGHQGKLIEHLASQVSKALGQTWIGAPRTVYDNTLKEQVKILQRQQGLNPDGVAGPITWIHINSLNQAGAPSLHKPRVAD